MLAFFRVERNAALLLLAAAMVGIIAANSPAASAVSSIAHLSFKVFGTSTDLRGVVSDFLMTGFFLLIGLELKRELHSGVFKDRRALALPSLAALLGAVVPAVIFLALVGSGSPASAGWPIPMATDVTFALAIFSIFAKTMPTSARTFLLSFAVIDDLIAIVVIALFLGTGLNLGYLLAAVLSVFALFYVSRMPINQFTLGLMLVLPLIAWNFTRQAGISPLVVGVAIGLVVPIERVAGLERRLHPWVSLGVLPLFAFFATQVPLNAGLNLTAALTVAILLRPVGKIIGINAGVLLARILVKNSGFDDLRSTQLARISVLGGVGFTVALLISGAVFGVGSELGNQATLATLAAMVISMVLGAIALSWRRN